MRILMIRGLVGLTLSLGLASGAKAETVALGFDVIQSTPSPMEATANAPKSVALKFSPNGKIPAVMQPANLAQTTAQTTAKTTAKTTANQLDDYPPSILFRGGSTSLVAKAVGSAEGTRTPTGGYTHAYYGHVDPGNGVWNLGSFSYQHGATSPEQADLKQLRRLQQQTLALRRQAKAKAFTLSLLEELNGIDLANQAPLAALDRGYIDWLHVARQQPMGQAEQIIWARTKAFLDPDTGYWDAPGLGNHWDGIYHDQRRRYVQIARAVSQH